MAHDMKRLQLPTEKEKHIAFGEFYGEYHVLCFSIAVGITHDTDRAKDIVQESYIAIYKQVTERGLRFESKSHARDYLLKTVKNTALDNKAAQARKVEVDAVVDTLISNTTQEQMFVEEKKLSALRKALKDLPAKYRYILKLRFYEKMTLAQIAEKTGWPIPTIQYREKKALETLHKCKMLRSFFHKNGV
jgi:RNA polymerase sigma-70 factor (ECF subfamily)